MRRNSNRKFVVDILGTLNAAKSKISHVQKKRGIKSRDRGEIGRWEIRRNRELK